MTVADKESNEAFRMKVDQFENSLAWPPLKDTPAGMPCDDSLIGCFANRSIPDVVSKVLFQEKWPSPGDASAKAYTNDLQRSQGW